MAQILANYYASIYRTDERRNFPSLPEFAMKKRGGQTLMFLYGRHTPTRLRADVASTPMGSMLFLPIPCVCVQTYIGGVLAFHKSYKAGQ